MLVKGATGNECMVVRAVDTDAVVLKHQATSILSVD